MKCYALATIENRVLLVTPTGAATLTPEEGHRLLFYGTPVNVDGATLVRSRRTVTVVTGGAYYTVDARTLGRLFRGDRVRCLLYPVAPQPGGGQQ